MILARIAEPPPNYDTRAPEILACAIIMIVITTLAVILRFWSRAVVSNLEFWWDDWALLATMVMSHLFLITDIYQTTVGLGKHQWMVPLSDVTPNAMSAFIGVVFYTATICLIKISALLLYARLFKTKGWMVVALWTIGTVIVLWTIVLMIFPHTNCRPLAKSVYPLLKGYCTPRPGWDLGSTIANAILDFIVLILPMPVIWGLQMTRKRRIGYTFVFLLGYCSAFLSFARFIIIAKDPLLLSASAPVNTDRTWDFVPILELSMLEGPFAIMALCGPQIHLLVARVIKYRTLNSLFSSHTPLTDRSGYSSSRHAPARGVASKDGGSSTTAFASEVGEEERLAGMNVPMGSISMKREVRVDGYSYP